LHFNHTIDFSPCYIFTSSVNSEMVKHVTGGYKVKYHPEGPEGPEWEIDYSPPFKRVDMIKGLEERLKVKMPNPTELHTEGELIITGIHYKFSMWAAFTISHQSS